MMTTWTVNNSKGSVLHKADLMYVDKNDGSLYLFNYIGFKMTEVAVYAKGQWDSIYQYIEKDMQSQPKK